MISELINKISKNPSVFGIVSMGTTATILNKSSDIDLVITLEDDLPDLFSGISEYKGKILDLYFFRESKLKSILKESENVIKDSIESKLITWIKTGEIEYDNSKILQQIKEKEFIYKYDSEEDKYNSWFGINFNFKHNERYFNSNDTLYNDALKFRLLYSVMDLLVGYIKFENIDWKGEKEAIKFLKRNNVALYKIFMEFLDETNLAKKFELYSQLVQSVTSKYNSRINTKNDTLVLLNSDVQELKKATDFLGV